MIWTAAAHRIHTWLEQAKPGALDATSPVASSDATPSMDPARATTRVREWRRRVLSRKGVRIQGGMVQRQDLCSLAVLDDNGFVVFWHDGMPGAQPTSSTSESAGIVGGHVAQFYAPSSIAEDLACAHLRRALIQEGSSEFGWCRRPNGTVFWGVTIVEPLRLRDGRLQGFTHVTRAVLETRQHAMAAERVRRETPWKVERTPLLVGAWWQRGAASGACAA